MEIILLPWSQQGHQDEDQWQYQLGHIAADVLDIV